MKRYAPLLVLVILLGSLTASQAAEAASPTAAAPIVPHLALRDAAEPKEEGEDDEAEGSEAFEAEGCGGDEFEFGEDEEFEEDEFEFEAEECAEEEAKKAGGEGFVSAPAVCLVRRAESSVATLPGADRVLLTVRYKTDAPTEVIVGLKLKDRKGSLTLEHATKHLGANGVLHLTTKLDAAAMERAQAAHEFDVSLRAPETPGFCGNLLEQRLHVSGAKRRAGASRAHHKAHRG
ncbi:MAG TPA: hypothetical protein VGI17_15120 [Solirubrobacterales bacterium]|jgi:hypothetical protein